MNETLCNLSFASTQQRCNSFLSVVAFLGNEAKKPRVKVERYGAEDIEANHYPPEQKSV